MSYSILIVDDEVRNRQLLRLILEMDGFTVSEAGNGQEALQQLTGQRPDLLLLDMDMPVMGGLETCRQLRSRGETADLPIIMMSGNVSKADIRKSLNTGVDKFIRKPFLPDNLLADIVEMLTARSKALYQ